MSRQKDGENGHTQKYYPPEHRDAVFWILVRPVAPVWIPAEVSPQDPIPAPINQVYRPQY